MIRWWCMMVLVSAVSAASELAAPWPSPDAIRTWRVGSGLPHQRVQAVAQTEDGYLWVGTAQGLARFDGREFQVVDLPAEVGGRGAAITRLAAGRDNRLWVGTARGQLLCGQGMVFAAAAMSSKNEFPSGFEILIEDVQGKLWITTRGGDVFRLLDGLLEDMSQVWRAGRDWSSGQVRLCKDGTPMAYSVNMIAMVHDGGLIPLHYFQPGMVFHAPSVHGACWVSDATGIHRLSDDGLSDVVGPANWGDRPLTFGLEDHRGNLWLATQGFGLLCYDHGGLVRRLDTRDGLCGDFAVCLYEDHQGNLWVGSDGGGLSRITPAVFATAGRREGLSSDRVTAVLPSPDGKIWIGTDGDGLNGYDGENFSPEPLVPLRAQINALANIDHRLWIGMQNGLWHIDHGKLWNIGGWLEASRQVNALLPDRHGGLWVGQRLKGRTIRYLNDKAEPIELEGVKNEMDVVSFAEGEDGSIWIATDGAGLFCWNQNGVAKAVGNFKQVVALAPRKNGGIWVSADGSLYQLNSGGVRGVDIDLSHIQAMAEVDDGLWVSGNFGVRFLKIAANGIVVRSFSQSDGMPELQGASKGFPQVYVENKVLWFASSTGVLRVNGAAMEEEPPLHSLKIDAVLANGEVRWRVGDSTSLTLNPDSKNVEFQLSSIDLRHPETARHFCRLDGVDAGWRDLGVSRVVNYPTLPSGRHHFRVKAVNQSGAWSAEKMLEFELLPPLTQRLWFIVAMTGVGMILVGGSVWLVSVWRTRRKLASLRVEQAVSAERARIASDLHDQLGAELTGIALLGDHLRMEAPGDAYLVENVTEISQRARCLARDMEETVWALDPAQDHLESLISYLSQSMSHWLRNTGIRCHLDVPDQADRFGLDARQRRQIFLACKEVVHNAIKHASATEVVMRIERVEDQLCLTLRDNGRGFAVDHVTRGRGLYNIRQRLILLGGDANLATRVGGPTEWNFCIPLPSHRFL